MKLYHGTSRRRLRKILTDGATGPVYFTDAEHVARLYAHKKARDDGDDFADVLEVDIAFLDASLFSVDYPSLDEPVGCQREECLERLAEVTRENPKGRSGGARPLPATAWRESLYVCRCVLYNGSVPAEAISHAGGERRRG